MALRVRQVSVNAFKLVMISSLLSVAASSSSLADENDPPFWKDTNSQAIFAMRSEHYEEAEKLFQKALSECPSDDDRESIRKNLDVLHEQMNNSSSKGTIPGKVQTTVVRPNGSDVTNGEAHAAGPDDEIHGYIRSIDEQIKKADSAGDLDTLQSLFAKKANALKHRDGSETLDYAYCLHFRAQVLEHMGRADEANALETHAARLRDRLRKISVHPLSTPIQARSNLKEMNFNFNYRKTAPPKPDQAYAPVKPPPPRGGLRTTFGSHTGSDTSGFLNGNPNGN